MELILGIVALVLAVIMVAAQFQLFAIRRLLEQIERHGRPAAVARPNSTPAPFQQIEQTSAWPAYIGLGMAALILLVLGVMFWPGLTQFGY